MPQIDSLKSDTYDNDKYLRLKLLTGQIILAALVSIVFLTVGHGNTKSFGKSIELDNNQKLIQNLLQKIDSFETFEQSHFTQLMDTHYQNSFGDDYTVINLCKSSTQCFYWSNKPKLGIRIPEDLPVNKTDFFYEDENQNAYLYFCETSEKNYKLIFYREIAIFNQGLKKASTRLLITSFFTFWIAIWTALFISGITLQRIEKFNKRLSYIARHDSLTSLPNRGYLISKLSKLTEKCETPIAPRPYADPLPFFLLLIDLDKFKEVNDSMGHDAGDTVLKEITHRLSTLVGKENIYRYGGDEFVTLIKSTDINEATQLAKNIIAECSKPVKIGTQHFGIGASVGIAAYPENADNPIDLLKCADIAMYQAKNLRTGSAIYKPVQKETNLLKVKLRGQIKKALANNEFVLFYQPKISIQSGQIESVEALVRWNHPEVGILSPGVFIDLVEETDAVHDFCQYIILHAVRQIKIWQEEGIHLSVAVNISPYNVLDESLAEMIATLLYDYELEPKYLEIELTESASMVDIETIIDSFIQLKEVGIKLSIDDFGTGMSSLAYMKNIKVDTIKIDRSFVDKITTDERDQAIIKHIITLCQDLKFDVVAEGVETKDQYEMLSELGCQYAQGYYFSPPVPSHSVLTLYREANNSTSELAKKIALREEGAWHI